MAAIPMKTTGALDKNTVLSLNHTDRQCVKDSQTLRQGIQTSAPRESRRMQQPSQPVQQSTRPTLADMPVPHLQNTVQKGQKIPLPVTNADVLEACFGWNTTDCRCDLDVSAFLLGADGKVLGDSWFVFYGQTQSPDKSTEFIAEGSGCRETMQVNLSRLDARVQRIVFVLTINEALENNLHFGMVKDAYIAIRKQADKGNDIAGFLMTEYYTNVVSMMIGELYRHNGTWKFNAVGNGISKDLAGLCEWYGVAVD